MTKKEQQKKLRREYKKKFFIDVRDIFIFLGFLFLIKIFILDFGFVSGHSMEPNMKDGQIIVIKKWNILFNEQEKGLHFYDKVALRNVRIEGVERPLSLAKRVIGLPGDKIKIKDGDIYRNGYKVDEHSIKEKAVQPNQTFVIKDNEIFVMGDNRNHSTDSRHFGPLPLNNVSGEISANFDAKWLSTFLLKTRTLVHLEPNL